MLLDLFFWWMEVGAAAPADLVARPGDAAATTTLAEGEHTASSTSEYGTELREG